MANWFRYKSTLLDKHFQDEQFNVFLCTLSLFFCFSLRRERGIIHMNSLEFLRQRYRYKISAASYLLCLVLMCKFPLSCVKCVKNVQPKTPRVDYKFTFFSLFHLFSHFCAVFQFHLMINCSIREGISGSARGFGYTVSGVFFNEVFGIFLPKYGY